MQDLSIKISLRRKEGTWIMPGGRTFAKAGRLLQKSILDQRLGLQTAENIHMQWITSGNMIMPYHYERLTGRGRLIEYPPSGLAFTVTLLKSFHPELEETPFVSTSSGQPLVS